MKGIELTRRLAIRLALMAAVATVLRLCPSSMFKERQLWRGVQIVEAGNTHCTWRGTLQTHPECRAYHEDRFSADKRRTRDEMQAMSYISHNAIPIQG